VNLFIECGSRRRAEWCPLLGAEAARYQDRGSEDTDRN
jgi:hypothetical protein